MEFAAKPTKKKPKTLSTPRKIILITGISLGVLILALFLWAVFMSSPTSGKHIASYDNPHPALMIIDVQEETTGSMADSSHSYKNSADIVDAVNRAVHRATATGMPVVVVNQEFSGPLGTLWSKLFLGGRLMKGTPGAKSDARVQVPELTTFSKPRGDAFSNKALDEYLRINKIYELYLMGVDAEFCVLLTGRGAVNRGYKVSIIRDGVGMLNESKADKILAEYAKYRIDVVDSLPAPY